MMSKPPPVDMVVDPDRGEPVDAAADRDPVVHPDHTHAVVAVAELDDIVGGQQAGNDHVAVAAAEADVQPLQQEISAGVADLRVLETGQVVERPGMCLIVRHPLGVDGADQLRRRHELITHFLAPCGICGA